MRWLTVMCVALLSSSVSSNLLANGLRGAYLGVRGNGLSYGYLSPQDTVRFTYNRLLGQEIGFVISGKQYTGKVTKVDLPQRDLTLPSPIARGATEAVLNLQVGDIKAEDLSHTIEEEIKLVRLLNHSNKKGEKEIWKAEVESDNAVDLLEAPIVSELSVMDFLNNK